MQSDGFRKFVRRTRWWSKICYRREQEARRAIVYHMYGRGFGWALSQSERTLWIRQFVDNEKAVARMK